jgi:hypothetical protein
MMLGFDGAIAMSPIEMCRSFCQTGKKLIPPLIVFQIPPAAAAK